MANCKWYAGKTINKVILVRQEPFEKNHMIVLWFKELGLLLLHMLKVWHLYMTVCTMWRILTLIINLIKHLHLKKHINKIWSFFVTMRIAEIPSV